MSNAAFRAASATPVQAVARHGRPLADLTSPDDSPALYALIEARAFEHDNPDGEFTIGLDRVLDGGAIPDPPGTELPSFTAQPTRRTAKTP